MAAELPESVSEVIVRGFRFTGGSFPVLPDLCVV